MRKIENQCVDCVLPCIGNSCPHKNVKVDYCDECGDEGAKYRMNGEDLCYDCAKNRLIEDFQNLTFPEQSKMLGVNLYEIKE